MVRQRRPRDDPNEIAAQCQADSLRGALTSQDARIKDLKEAIKDAVNECHHLAELLASSACDDLSEEQGCDAEAPAGGAAAGGDDGGEGLPGAAPFRSLRVRLVSAVVSLSRARHEAEIHRAALASLIEELAREGVQDSSVDLRSLLRSHERRAARERPFAPRDPETNAALIQIARRLNVPLSASLVSRRGLGGGLEGRGERGESAGAAGGALAAAGASSPAASSVAGSSRSSGDGLDASRPGELDSDAEVEVASSDALAPNDRCPITNVPLEELKDPVEDLMGVVYERKAVLDWIEQRLQRLPRGQRRGDSRLPCPLAGSSHYIAPTDFQRARKVIRRQLAIAMGKDPKRKIKVKREAALIV